MGFNVRSYEAENFAGVTTWGCLEKEIDSAKKALKKNGVDVQALLDEVHACREKVQALMIRQSRNAEAPADLARRVRHFIAFQTMDVEDPMPLRILPESILHPEHHHEFDGSHASDERAVEAI